MKAVIVKKYGGPEVLEIVELDKPKPEEDEILIRIHNSAVTAAGIMMREGIPKFGRLIIGLTKPKASIPGTDLSGVVEAVGDDVKNFEVGDEVVAMTDTDMGAHAQYICMEDDDVVTYKPTNMSFAEATGIIDGACTALPFLRDEAGIKAGDHILINGASGSIGTAAVQLAKFFEAEVTGVCSTKNLELVASLGADHVIDYTKENIADSGTQYDFIFDTVGKLKFSDAKKALKENGVYLTPVLELGALWRMLISNHFTSKKTKFAATGLRDEEVQLRDLKYLVGLMEEGKLKCVLDKTYPLDDVREAHAYVDKGHKKGNVVLEMISTEQ